VFRRLKRVAFVVAFQDKMMGEEISSMAERHRMALDALRNNISTAPAGRSVNRKIVRATNDGD